MTAQVCNMQQDERFLIATSSHRLALTVEPLPTGRGCNPAFFLNMVSNDLGLKRASLSATFWPVVAFWLDFLAIQRPTKPASACPPPPMVSRRMSRDFFSSLPLLSCHSKQLSSHWSLRTGRGRGGGEKETGLATLLSMACIAQSFAQSFAVMSLQTDHKKRSRMQRGVSTCN